MWSYVVQLPNMLFKRGLIPGTALAMQIEIPRNRRTPALQLVYNAILFQPRAYVEVPLLIESAVSTCLAHFIP